MGLSEDLRKDPPAEVGLEGNLYILPSNCRAQQEGDGNDIGLLCLHLYCSWGHNEGLADHRERASLRWLHPGQFFPYLTEDL